MTKAFCEDCQEPQTITPTGKLQREGWTAEWWQLAPHRDKRTGLFCRGSGKYV